MTSDTTTHRIRLAQLPRWLITVLFTLLLTLVAGVRDRYREQDPERGDVPGWVMVTVMTAILVVAILGIFEPQIRKALSGIIDQVSNAGTKN